MTSVVKQSIIISSSQSKRQFRVLTLLCVFILATVPVLSAKTLASEEDLESSLASGCDKNCLTCDQETNVCLLCKNHTSVSVETGICLPVPVVIEGCLYYSTSDPSTCKMCHEGFYGQKCEPCMDDCRVCSGLDVCMVCNIGHVLISGKCDVRSDVNFCDIAMVDVDKCKLCVEGNLSFLIYR